MVAAAATGGTAGGQVTVRAPESDDEGAVAPAPAQKQLYLWNRTGYPHQILNEHSKRINNAESDEISFSDLYRFLAWTVTSDSWKQIDSTRLCAGYDDFV